MALSGNDRAYPSNQCVRGRLMRRDVRTVQAVRAGLGALAALGALASGCGPSDVSNTPRRPSPRPRPAVRVVAEIAPQNALGRVQVSLLGTDRRRGQVFVLTRHSKALGLAARSRGGGGKGSSNSSSKGSSGGKPGAKDAPRRFSVIDTYDLATGRRVGRRRVDPPPRERSLLQMTLYSRSLKPKRPARLQTGVDLVRRLGPGTTTARPPLVAVSPDGAWVAYNRFADKLWLLSVGAGSGEAKPRPGRRLNQGSPACYRPTFSPDSRYLAFHCFVRKQTEYCPALVALRPPASARNPTARGAGGRTPRTRWLCQPKGYVHSGPFWQPDSEAFYALIRRGFGAYRDPEPGLCLTRVTVEAEPKKRRSTPLWCQALDRKRDMHRRFRFRMDPQARTGVLLSESLEARSYTFRGDVPSPLAPKKRSFSGLTPNHRASRRCKERRQFAVSRNFVPTRHLNGYARSKGCAFDVRWIRLSDGEILAHLRDVPLPDIGLLAHATVLGSGGLLVTPACGGGVLLVDLRHERVHRRLRGRRFFNQRWDERRSLLLLEHVGRRRFRLVELDPHALLGDAPAPR